MFLFQSKRIDKNPISFTYSKNISAKPAHAFFSGCMRLAKLSGNSSNRSCTLTRDFLRHQLRAPNTLARGLSTKRSNNQTNVQGSFLEFYFFPFDCLDLCTVVFGKLRGGCGSSFLGGGVLGYGVLLFLGVSQGKLVFQLVIVFPSSSFLAFSRILWYRAFLNVFSSGVVGLGL